MILRRNPLIALVAVVVFLVFVASIATRNGQYQPEAVIPVSGDVVYVDATHAREREFTDSELRSALVSLCASNTPEHAAPEMAQEEIPDHIDSLDELMLSLSNRLSASLTAEHLHLAALLESDPGSQVELLDRAISRSPSDAFLAWTAVRICSDSTVDQDCPLQDWEQHLIAVDGQNSETWMRIAANRYAAGETDAALEAMRLASTAAETRVYWTEAVEMIERGLAAAGSEYPFPERASMAFGVAGIMFPNYGDFTRMCREQSSRSSEWGYACLGYGELAESQSMTELGVSVGLSIQKLALEALGEMDQAADVEQRLEDRRQERSNLGIAHAQLIQQLTVSNPTLFSAFLAAIRSEGEAAALRRVAADVDRLLERQPELACE